MNYSIEGKKDLGMKSKQLKTGELQASLIDFQANRHFLFYYFLLFLGPCGPIAFPPPLTMIMHESSF